MAAPSLDLILGEPQSGVGLVQGRLRLPQQDGEVRLATPRGLCLLLELRDLLQTGPLWWGRQKAGSAHRVHDTRGMPLPPKNVNPLDL